MKTKSRSIIRLLPATAAACVLSLVSAVTASPANPEHGDILTDDFSSGVSADWKTAYSTTATKPALDITDTVGPEAGNAALQYTWATSVSPLTGVATRTFAPVTLQAGETLSLSFNYKGSPYTNANQYSHILFGFSNSKGTSDLGDDYGYLAGINARPDSTSGTAKHFSLNKGPLFDAYSARATTTTSNGATTLASSLGTGETAFNVNADNLDVVFKFSMSITRLANGDLQIVSLYENTTASISFTRTSVVASTALSADFGYTFDTLNLASTRFTVGFAIDDLVVNYAAAVPEPATTASFAALVILGVVVLDRRLRPR